MFTQLNERDVETYIDNELKNLKWNDNPQDMNECNVYKQRVKTTKQKNKLKGKKPDYVLYKEKTDEPLAVIEAKRPFENLEKAQSQAMNYAEKINAPIVFVTDGIYTKTHHMKKQKPLYLNGEEVDELLSHSTLLNFLNDNSYNTQDKRVITSRQELINIFKSINNDLRDSGVTNGLPRIHLFTNMLFLKVISELAELKDEIVTVPPKQYLWNNFKEKKGLDLLDFLNKQAFDYFKKSYGGEVLSKIDVLEGKENILNSIIDSLDDLWLSDTNADIKGEAFEFFLRSYGGAETDFGEYFTPRHIVKTMVKLLNPKFGEKVYDGFCGTGGMLIESFKYMKKRTPLNQNTIKQLKNETIYGGEFSTMYRIAKMNMILAGDGHSNILRQDSYEKKQTNKYDVVITNIPFGSKMKTNYLSQYGYNGVSAEICGVLHSIDALNSENENSRAAIIVPEGILFNKQQKAYRTLRQELTERYDLKSIISLPRQAFSDANVKSNILIVGKKKQTNKHIWFFDIKNDGYTLDKARKKREGNNDIDVLLSSNNLNVDEIEKLKRLNFKILYKEKLKENNYIFLPNQYIEQEIDNYKHKMVSLSELEEQKIIEFSKGEKLNKNKISETGEYECILYGELYTKYESPFITEITSKTDYNEGKRSLKDDILIPSTTTADSEGIAIAKCVLKDEIRIGGDINIIRVNNKKVINPKFLTLSLNFPLKNELAKEEIIKVENLKNELEKFAKGANILHLDNDDIKKIKIPLPDLKEQNDIVNEFIKKEEELSKKEEEIKQLKKEAEKNILNKFFVK